MDITRINIHEVEKKDAKLKAVASVTIQDAIAIHGIKIIDSEKGLFISMPARKNSNNEYKDIVHPINAEAREHLERSIIEEYQKMKNIKK